MEQGGSCSQNRSRWLRGGVVAVFTWIFQKANGTQPCTSCLWRNLVLVRKEAVREARMKVEHLQLVQGTTRFTQNLLLGSSK